MKNAAFPKSALKTSSSTSGPRHDMTVEELKAAMLQEARAKKERELRLAKEEADYEAEQVKREAMRRLYNTSVSSSAAEGEEAMRFAVPAGASCCGCARSCQGFLADRSTSVAAIVCHPWGPLGGSYSDINVVGLVDLLGRVGGLTTLRFNFRTGLGRGQASADDVRGAWAYLQSLDSPPAKLLLVGYSYGAAVCADVAPSLAPSLAGLVLVSPPLGWFGLGCLFCGRNVTRRAQSGLVATPKLLLVGADDQFCGQATFEAFARGCRGPTEWHVVRGEAAEGACAHGERGCCTTKAHHFNMFMGYTERHVRPWAEATYGCPLEELHRSDGARATTPVHGGEE